jgi:hypothetical protein
VSRKILRKLDRTDWNLLDDLEHILQFEEKDQIASCVMDLLQRKGRENENEVFRKSKSEIKKELCEK